MSEALSEIPPAVRCARCDRSDCGGCTGRQPLSADLLAWEGTGPWLPRLFRTAEATALEPERFFGALSAERLWPALGFAALAEGLAITSLGVAVLGLSWLVMPSLFAGRSGLLVGAGALLALFAAALLMLLLHLIWGLSLELGARAAGLRSDLRRGVRFGLYACGWDLLTSPAGLVLSFGFRGIAAAWQPVAAAVRVPRPALGAYLTLTRQLTEAQRRRTVLVAALVTGGALLVGSLTSVVLLVMWAVS